MAGPADLVFSEPDKAALLRFARKALEAAVRGEPDPLPAFLSSSGKTAPWRQSFPCFVSVFSRGNRLRGCIGCTETADSLAQNVQRFARLAALEDPRFRPVEPPELPALLVRVSVLGPLKKLPGLEALEIGRHGLSVQQLPRRGVLLAEVATQFGWTKEKFLTETFRKAGISPLEADVTEVFYFDEIEIAESAKG